MNETTTNFFTDICSDSDDICSTDAFATIDVIEYELEDSSSSEDLYSHGSSSGEDVHAILIINIFFSEITEECS